MFMSNSRINTKVNDRGDVSTETVNNPRGLVIEIDSKRWGREGTEMTVGFEDAANRFLKLDGREARTLFNALYKHYNEVDSSSY